MCGVHLWGSSAEAAGGPGSSTRCNLETVLARPCCHSKTPRLRGLNNRQASAHSSGVRRSKFNGRQGQCLTRALFLDHRLTTSWICKGLWGIKLFSTQKEALDYAKSLCVNKDDGSYVLLHGLDGKIRKY